LDNTFFGQNLMQYPHSLHRSKSILT